MEDPRRNSYAGFVAAIEIFAKHEEKGMNETFMFEAEHDIIYSHIEVDKVTDEEAAQLVALGWHKDRSLQLWAFFT